MRHPFVERSRQENLLITAMVTGIATVSASTSLLTLFSGDIESTFIDVSISFV